MEYKTDIYSMSKMVNDVYKYYIRNKVVIEHCSSGGRVFGIGYTTRVVLVPLHNVIHIHTLTYYIIIRIYTDRSTYEYIHTCTLYYTERESK